MAFAPRRLTKTFLDSIEPGDKLIQIRDTEIPGFGALITPSGHRSFFLHFNIGRSGHGHRARRKFATLGEHGVDLTLYQAREKARRWRQEARDGIDPTEALRRKPIPPPLTFGAVAERYLAEFSARHHRPRSQEEVRRLLRLHVIRVLGDMPIEAIRRAHVSELHAAVSAHAPIAANRMLAVISGIFTFAEEKELVLDGHRPTRGIAKNPERRRGRYLRGPELAEFVATLDRLSAQGDTAVPAINPVLAALFELLLFTGARRGELATMRWSQIDLANRIAEVDSKTGPRTIYLNARAMELVTRMQTIRLDDNPHIFWGIRTGRPVAEFKRGWAKVKAAARFDDDAGDPLVIHSLRHTFATHARNSGEDLTIIARLLGHRVHGVTEVYAHVFSRTLQEASDRIGRRLQRLCGSWA